MMRLFLFALSLGSRLFGVDFSFDFRESHKLGEVLENFDQLPVLEDRGERGKIFYIKDASVEVILPGGQFVRTGSQALIIDAKIDGTISNFKISGPIMPLNEAFEAGKSLYTAFSIPHDRLEKWHPKAKSAGHDAASVSNAQSTYYPHVFIEIKDSMNRMYPWSISVSFGWIDEEPEKHSEIWGRENNPKPPTGLEVISLEAPSGKTYDRADAWEEANRRQNDLDRKLGQVRGPDGRLVVTQEGLPIELPNKSESPAEKPRSLVWIYWMLGVLILGGVGVLVWNSRRGSSAL